MERAFYAAEKLYLEAIDYEDAVWGEICYKEIWHKIDIPKPPAGYHEKIAKMTVGELSSPLLVDHKDPEIAGYARAWRAYENQKEDREKAIAKAKSSPAYVAAKKAIERTYDAVDAAYRALLEEPAGTPAEMLIKARVAMHWDCDLDLCEEPGGKAFFALVADFERLAS